MKKPWSISTTVRNPERLRSFLRVLKELEGKPFNSENQINYQILLIRDKLYKPTILTKVQREYFSGKEKEMSFSVAQKIFNVQDYNDPPMRGRNSVAPLNKMGLCVAKNSATEVSLTPLGEYFLSENYDLGRLFFVHFLKWQLPNPASRTFSGKDGFSIKPFIGTLHLINEVNKEWAKLGNDPIGINKDEFILFVPTLIDYRQIKNQTKKLIEYRLGLRLQKDDKNKKAFRDTFRTSFARHFLGSNNSSEIKKLLNNLKDYGDNAIRYFRLTRFIHIRGGEFYVDLEPRRSIEIEKLLLTDSATPLTFESPDIYVEYLADLEQPVLPWETSIELRRIALSQREDVDTLVSDIEAESYAIPTFQFLDSSNLDINKLNQYVADMRAYRTRLQELLLHIKSQEIGTIENCIRDLRGIHSSQRKKSIELERLSTLALNALNDAISIKPNYPVGDDNEPTFTAPANRPDIECFYEGFNSVCEVTMLTNRTQWYNEGPPVMRHIRRFEDKYREKPVYCLFIAPRLHQDTIETFWMAAKHGYRGANQRIVPLSITQFILILDTLLEFRVQGRIFRHEHLLQLYDDVISLTAHVANSDEWIETIPGVIDEWKSNASKDSHI